MKTGNFIILQGSSKSNGNTRIIVDYILSQKEGRFIDLKTKNISYFDYDHHNIDDDFLNVVDQILNCEVIIFATPIYWYNMSAVMKTFFDRLSDITTLRKDLGRQLKGKKILVIACGSDDIEYPALWEPFKLTAEYLDMVYVGHAHTWIESGELPDVVKFTLDQLMNKLN